MSPNENLEPKKRGPKPKGDMSHLGPIDVSDKLEKGEISYGANSKVGYVTKSGKLYKDGYKGKSVHISWKGSVVLPRCPECHHISSVTEQVRGICEKCNYDGSSELE